MPNKNVCENPAGWTPTFYGIHRERKLAEYLVERREEAEQSK